MLTEAARCTTPICRTHHCQHDRQGNPQHKRTAKGYIGCVCEPTPLSNSCTTCNIIDTAYAYECCCRQCACRALHVTCQAEIVHQATQEHKRQSVAAHAQPLACTRVVGDCSSSHHSLPHPGTKPWRGGMASGDNQSTHTYSPDRITNDTLHSSTPTSAHHTQFHYDGTAVVHNAFAAQVAAQICIWRGRLYTQLTPSQQRCFTERGCLTHSARPSASLCSAYIAGWVHKAHHHQVKRFPAGSLPRKSDKST